MHTSPRRSALRRLEARFWTGPLAHLIGGGLDLAQAIVRAGRLRRERGPEL